MGKKMVSSYSVIRFCLYLYASVSVSVSTSVFVFASVAVTTASAITDIREASAATVDVMSSTLLMRISLVLSHHHPTRRTCPHAPLRVTLVCAYLSYLPPDIRCRIRPRSSMFVMGEAFPSSVTENKALQWPTCHIPDCNSFISASRDTSTDPTRRDLGWNGPIILNVKSEITGYLRRTLKLSHTEEFKDPLNGLKDEGADIRPKSYFDPTNAFWNNLWKDHASSAHRISIASKRKPGTGGGGALRVQWTPPYSGDDFACPGSDDNFISSMAGFSTDVYPLGAGSNGSNTSNMSIKYKGVVGAQVRLSDVSSMLRYQLQMMDKALLYPQSRIFVIEKGTARLIASSHAMHSSTSIVTQIDLPNNHTQKALGTVLNTDDEVIRDMWLVMEKGKQPGSWYNESVLHNAQEVGHGWK